MAPRKSPPLNINHIKHTTGITFSFRLTALDFKGFVLEPTVHTISSLSLVRRMNRKPKKIQVVKKRKPGTTTSIVGECVWCGVHKTAQWRRGPNGSRSLCNRCGIEWAKQVKTEARDFEISVEEAENKLIEQFKAGQKIHKYQQRVYGESSTEPSDMNSDV